MLVSRMIAEPGFMPKVSGISSVTPLGAPSPGSTPTRMPRNTPTIISMMLYGLMAMANPFIRSGRLSNMVPPPSIPAEQVFQRALEERCDKDVFEEHEQNHRSADRDDDRHPRSMPADEPDREQEVECHAHIETEAHRHADEHDHG